jgi:hypothetical protein
MGGGAFFPHTTIAFRRFRGRTCLPFVDPPAPSSPASLTASVRGGEPGPLAGGLCIAIGVVLLPWFSLCWLFGLHLGLGCSCASPAAAVGSALPPAIVVGGF